MKYRLSGFTLVEVLIAMSIFALITTTAYAGLHSINKVRTQLDSETSKWEQLNQFFSRIEGEVGQCIARPIRISEKATLPALVGYSSPSVGSENIQLAFTRMQGVDTNGEHYAPQRIGYRLRDHSLELIRWKSLDSSDTSFASVDVVLNNVSDFKILYLTNRHTWESQWPTTYSEDLMPVGIQIEISLLSGESVRRFFSLI